MNPFQQAGFAGPYKLAQYEQTVRRGEIGLYVFLDLFGEPKYIARSDSDLASRVRGWTQTYDSFWVEYHAAPRGLHARMRTLSPVSRQARQQDPSRAAGRRRLALPDEGVRAVVRTRRGRGREERRPRVQSFFSRQ